MRITLDCFPGGRRRALAMSYDDGTIHDRRLVAIFNRYGIRGTFHLNSGRLDIDNRLQSSEIKELFTNHEVSAHSVSHPQLPDLPVELLIDEIRGDRLALESLVGYPVRGMSYPFGTWSEQVIQVLAILGIEYARTVETHNKFSVPPHFLRWPSTCHHKGDLLNLAKKFKDLEPRGSKALMYVWGHSYEFDRQNNWELIEEFCATIGGDESIWYATTIEIVDYLKALARLQFSAAGTIVTNPGARPCWIAVDGAPVEIAPGEMKML